MILKLKWTSEIKYKDKNKTVQMECTAYAFEDGYRFYFKTPVQGYYFQVMPLETDNEELIKIAGMAKFETPLERNLMARAKCIRCGKWNSSFHFCKRCLEVVTSSDPVYQDPFRFEQIDYLSRLDLN